MGYHFRESHAGDLPRCSVCVASLSFLLFDQFQSTAKRYGESRWLMTDAAIKISSSVSQSSDKARSGLSQHGVTYENGRVQIKTDRAAPSRDEYIASTQRAFERGAKKMQAHPDAFRHGPGSGSASPSGASTAVETP